MTVAMAADDPLPVGPFRVGMTWDFGGKRFTPPYTIVDADGRPVAGHIESKTMAQLLVALLNKGDPTDGL